MKIHYQNKEQTMASGVLEDTDDIIASGCFGAEYLHKISSEMCKGIDVKVSLFRVPNSSCDDNLIIFQPAHNGHEVEPDTHEEMGIILAPRAFVPDVPTGDNVVINSILRAGNLGLFADSYETDSIAPTPHEMAIRNLKSIAHDVKSAMYRLNEVMSDLEISRHVYEECDTIRSDICALLRMSSEMTHRIVMKAEDE